MDIKALLCNGIRTEEEEKSFRLLVKRLCKDVDRLYESIFKRKSKKERPSWMDEEEIAGEIVLLLFEKRNYICSREKVTFSLLRRIIKNHFIDKIKASFRFQEVSKTSTFSDNTNENGRLMIEDEVDNPTLTIEYILVDEYVDFLRENLTDREKEILCFEVFNVQGRTENNPFLSQLSRDARYQAWSRLKRKIRKIFSEELLNTEDISPEFALVFVDRVMSEICEKIVKE
jgi:DNA-directed RNA polymerase specialized sigma24 family protein